MGGRPMRGFGGLVAVTAAAAVVLTGPGASRAQATDRDVPDLALVVTNGTARTVALRSGQRDFARLWQLLAPTDTDSEAVPEAWQEGRLPQVRVTVLWGMTGIGGWPYTQRAPGGDIAMERVDQVFQAADGVVWVRTDPAPDVEDDDIRWHRASRTVFDELNRDGLLGPARTATTTSAAADKGTSDSVRWAVTGLAGGLALGVGGSLLIRRAAARHEPGPPREPRQELIDL
ncbi:hypothetical protein [Streptomyces sp. NPDC005485]|uniref:hypothetical protein n=1 Tax=Streptomyces sp. NPDC005485 TaxID=3155591 RepID=UPI0033A685FD